MADVAHWRTPTLGELADLSPSAVNTLEACPKRLAYQRDPAFKGLARPSPRTVLGTAAHRLTELVLTGQVGVGEEPRAEIEAAWDDEVEVACQKLQLAWSDRQVPLPVRWPGYAATRTRLVRRLTAAATSRGAVMAGGPGGHEAGLPWVERWLADQTNQIFGTPDLVEEVAGRLRVVDLKSGVHQGDVTTNQFRQLALYAHLVQVRLGRLVEEVAVVDARGAERVIPLRPEEVDEAVRALVGARDRFNRDVRDGRVTARVGADTCTYCPFRLVCQDYWRSDDRRPSDVAGTVAGVASGVAEVASVDGLPVRVVLAPGVLVSVGSPAVFLDLEPAGPTTWRMRWNSPARFD